MGLLGGGVGQSDKIPAKFATIPLLYSGNDYICALKFLRAKQENDTVMSDLMKAIQQEYDEKRTSFPEFGPGDTINVHLTIREGGKERIQQFKGTVIQIRNRGHNGQTFTVRKVSNGVGVERILPFISPNIAKIEVLRKGKARRARLFYLRNKQGKAAKVKEKMSF
jgi:large subunit ribosomal protein L19